MAEYVNFDIEPQEIMDTVKKVKNAVAIIDNKAPLLNVSMYYKPKNLVSDASRLQKISIENKALLKNINIINRTTGKVDSYWKCQPKATSNYETRELEMKRITLQNYEILQQITNQGPSVEDTKTLMKDWKRIKKCMELMVKYPAVLNQCKPDEILGGEITSSIALRRPRCFFNIGTENGENLGKMIIELYCDYVPKTAFNFLSLCKETNDGLTYKNSPFHCIIPGLACLGGDITKFNGTGGMSIYGELFPDENFLLHHAIPGVLSMSNTGPNSNNSQIIITFKRILTLDGKNVVFGKVVKGMDTLHKIEELGTKSGKPRVKVIITNCGQYFGYI